MNFGSSLQFRDLESVMQAYNNRDIDVWSIWQGKQYQFKGQGEAELRNALELLKNSGSNALYTLCIYEDVTDPKKVKSTTPHDGSFNFKLNIEEAAGVASRYEALNGVRSEIQAMREELAALKEGTEEEPKEQGGIAGLLGHPALAPLLPVLVEKAMSFLLGSTPPAPAIPYRAAPVALSGITPGSEIATAIDRLQKLDPKLAEHLAKLADIAEKDPNSFKIILSTLENY